MTALRPEAIAEALAPLDQWWHRCHAASVALVNAGVLPPSRVARGHCVGVAGPHSWVVVGPDVYARDAAVVDPTLWSYDASVDGVWVGGAADGRHVPDGGKGSIWTWGRPAAPEDDPVPLAPEAEARLSERARWFLVLMGPLDYEGWRTLMAAPVHGWPAAEVVAAMDDTEELASIVPIDRLGMLTNRNPGGLFLPGGTPDEYVVDDERDLVRVAARLAR